MAVASVAKRRKSGSVFETRVRPWIGWLVLVVLGAAVLVPGILYWQELPLRRAQREAIAGDVQTAFSRVSYFLDRHPDHGAALALKARLLVDFGRSQEALDIFDKVQAQTGVEMHAWAKAYMQMGRLSQAMPLLAKAVELDPENVDALYELAAVRLRLGLLEEATIAAEKLAAIPGQEARGQVFLAAIYNDLGNHAKSAIAYGKVLQYSPDASNLQLPPDELLLQYASVLITLGQTEKAVGFLERSVASRPTAAGYVILGNSQAQLGRAEEARRTWQTALELEPLNRHAREALANAELQDGKADEALTWLKPIENRDDLRSSTAYLFQRLYQMKKDQATADTWKKKAAKWRRDEQVQGQIDELQLKSPHSFWANVLRAYQFARAGNWLQAEDMMSELAPAAPKDDFVQDLDDAVRRRGELPSLDRLPIRKF